MAKKKKHEEHENLERWLVSYADFITLLFAVFVVLYALSQLDLAKFKDLKISLSEAFAPTIFKGKGSDSSMMESRGESVMQENRKGDQVHILPQINPQLELKKMQETKEGIEKAIEKGDLKGVSVKVDKRGLVISLVDSIFFDSGSAGIKPNAIKNLDKIAITLKKNFTSNKIRIEGHTDSDPISTAVFPSNWELSSARASSVVRHFINRFKMDKATFSAVGYADSVPLDTNNTSDGKQKNRRVEIVILNETTQAQEAGGDTSTADSTNSSDTSTENKNDDIEIISGGRKRASFNELEEKKETPEETEETGEEAVQPPLAESSDQYEPIGKPITPISETKKEPNEVLGVESKVYH